MSVMHAVAASVPPDREDRLRQKYRKQFPVQELGEYRKVADLGFAKMSDDASGPRPRAVEDIEAIHKRILELREAKFPDDGYKKHEPWCSYRRPGVSSCDCGGAR